MEQSTLDGIKFFAIMIALNFGAMLFIYLLIDYIKDRKKGVYGEKNANKH